MKRSSFGQLPAVIGLDPLAREARARRARDGRRRRRRSRSRPRVTLSPAWSRSTRSNLRVSSISARSPRAATSAMIARTAASTSAAASRLVARKARKRSAKSAARLSRRIGMACPSGPHAPGSPLNGARGGSAVNPGRRLSDRPRWTGTSRRRARTGPRSASSASRHSTSSRSTPPPEKIERHDPGGRVGLGKLHREQVEHGILAGRIDVAALAGS